MGYEIPADEAEDRALTEQEFKLTKWLLENGPGNNEEYLKQLSDAWVVAHCPCGCASIDFSIKGVLPDISGGMNIRSEYYWGNCGNGLCGIFVYANNGQLSGLEVWSIDGVVEAKQLPEISQLRATAE